MKRRIIVIALTVVAFIPTTLLLAQLGGARWLAMPVKEDPGVAWMIVTETPEYRVLRDFAAPGATRQMHHHADATWHILTLAAGSIVLTVEGEAPVQLAAGQTVTLKGGVNHTFTSTDSLTATIIEVFGRVPR